MIQEMYAEIQKQTDKHSVSELCEIYGVSRSGYYKWLKRAGQLNRYEKTHKILDSYVLDVHSHYPMMGYRQIRDKLYLEFGWIVSDPTVWKSMRRLGIHGYTRRRKAAATGTNLEHIRYANVLNRKFKAEKPIDCVEQHFSRVPGTVLDQITLGDPRITEEMARNAARLAGMDEAIRALPQGYATVCTDGMFSQGEWQLLSIARAAAADPAVLRLDEITANLDAETEARVLEALGRASRGRTVLSISHRIYENLGGRTVEIKPREK